MRIDIYCQLETCIERERGERETLNEGWVGVHAAYIVHCHLGV